MHYNYTFTITSVHELAIGKEWLYN